MLRITMSKSAAGAKKYYCESYYKEGSNAALDYYSEESQAIGRWGGNAAAMLGLKGDIAKGDFAMLCDNINPRTCKTLTGRKDTERTVGYDFTFNASKSVSMAYAFADEAEKQEILQAFQQSVQETMADVESGMQARVRANGKNENRMTGNIAYGEFNHFTTRPIDGVPDPHLHSHCFVFNATWDQEDSKWKAGQFKQVKQDAPYYEAVFHSKLASKLQALGYGIERSKNGFELGGVEKSTIDKFSRRTKEIEDYSKEHNITSDQQKSQIGAKTREAKRVDVSAAHQEKAWFSRLTSEEFTRLRSLKHSGGSQLNDGQAEKVARAAVQFSLNHHLERKSVSSDKEILTTAIKSSIGKATPAEVRRAFHRDGNILMAEENLRRFVTTKQALAEEKRLIVNATLLKNSFRPINTNFKPQNSELNDQQRKAVNHALSSTDGVILITGKAGVGKTTLMKEVKNGILSGGKQIFSFAPSSEASRGVQRSEGFTNADTVAKLIQDKKMHAAFHHQVIWIDEAGMLSNRDMNEILSIAQTQSARVILSGDTKQHTSVERGDAMRILQKEAGIKPITVDKIQRQKNADYREAVDLLSSGKSEKGFKKLEHIGAIHEIADGKERIQAIAQEYYQSAYSKTNVHAQRVLVVAPTHAEGDAVTQEIRQTLKEHEVLGSKERSYTTLKNLQLTEAEKQNPDSYAPGQILAFHQNAIGIKAGNRLEVSARNGDTIWAADGTGNYVDVPLLEARKFSVFEPKQIDVTHGDKIRITANGKCEDGKHLFNGSVFEIEGFDRQGNIKLSNGSTIDKDFGHFNYGYVSTSYASQGKTADKVIISQSSATFQASSMEQFYVSVSRGREAVSIYTDDKEHLKDVVTQSSQRTSATELMATRDKQLQDASRFNEQEKIRMDAHITNQRNYGLQNDSRKEQREGR